MIIRRHVHVGLAALSLASMVAGCELIAAVDRDKIPTPGGAGGSGGSGGATSSSGTGGMAPECTEATVEKCGSSKACLTYACESEMCVGKPAAKGTACNYDGGQLCDGAGKCVIASCTDGVKNGDETDLDCGGPCAPCGNDKTCVLNRDCETGYCGAPMNGAGGSGGSGGSAPMANVCQPCTETPQCDNDSVCNAAGKCVRLELGEACSDEAKCKSGHCKDGVCCDTACEGDCSVCAAAKGATTDGKCEFKPADADCGATPDLCEVQDQCDGAGTCVDKGVKGSTVVCRPSAGECDVEEKCDGMMAACPSDAFAPLDALCGDSATECSNHDKCDGAGKCVDSFKPSTTNCGPTPDLCEVQDECDGAGTCVDKGVKALGAVCRDKAGDCDVQDTCDGTTKTCTDVLVPMGAQGTCPAGGTCTGADKTTCVPSPV